MSDTKAKPKKKPRVVESTVVDHSYEDFSNAPIHPNADDIDLSNSNFPAKLHRILSTAEYDHIIGWMPHGRSWEVRNKELLETVVLKEHFNHARFESFNRQVNIWGFKVRKMCSQGHSVHISHHVHTI